MSYPYQIYYGTTLIRYSKEQVMQAMKVSERNAECYPNAPEGFWFEKDSKRVYIVAPFLDMTGKQELSFKESVRYYGEDNIRIFMETIK